MELDDYADSGTVSAILEGILKCPEPPTKITNVLVGGWDENLKESFVNEMIEIYDFLWGC